MAVLISDSRNPNYDGNWNTPLSWYRVEDHNLGLDGYGSSNPVSAAYPRFTPVTFANSGNFKGMVLALANIGYPTNAGTHRFHLQENKGSVTFDVSTEKVLKTSHGQQNGDQIMFVTTGTLPTGINNFTIYYVVNASTNDFQLSLSPGGSVVLLSGIPSGTHTVWQTRTYEDREMNQLFGVQSSRLGGIIKNIQFANTYPVDSTANKWRIGITSVLSLYLIYWLCSDYPSTNYPCFAVYSDTQSNWNDNDACIIDAKRIINTSIMITGAQHKANASTGHFNNLWAWVCSNAESQALDDVIKIEWQNPPQASYTFELTGILVFSGYSGLRIGSEENPIPYAKQAKIILKQWYESTTLRTGAIVARFFDSPNRIGNFNMSALILKGEIPAERTATLSQAAASGLVLYTEELTTWQPGDIIGFTFYLYQGSVARDNSWRTIQSVEGNKITLSGNISCALPAGAKLINTRGYGISISNDVNTQNGSLFFCSNICQVSGCLFEGVIVDPSIAATYSTIPIGATFYPDKINRSKIIVENNCFRGKFDQYGWGVGVIFIPEEGIEIKENHFLYAKGPTFLSPFYGSSFNSGQLLYKANIHFSGTWALNIAYSGFLVNSGYLIKNLVIEENIISNVGNVAGAGSIVVTGYKPVIRNNTFYGVTMGSLIFKNCVEGEVYGNKFDYCQYPYYIDNQLTVGVKVRNEQLGKVLPNLYDAYLNTAGLNDITFVDVDGQMTIDTTNQLLTVPGTKIAIVNRGLVQHEDIVYTTKGILKRCGSGIGDTTVRTAGTDKFSLRFQPISGTEILEWSQVVPTGNIQGKTMTVTAWVKINNAAFYVGIHTKPNLTVNFDDGTELYAVAQPGTDWQLLSVSFSPNTSFGQIKVTISGATDALTSDAYFYLDDMAIFYPPGSSLDLGGLDLWANALPVVPSIATNVNASDVWNIDRSLLNTFGSIGKAMVDLLKLTGNRVTREGDKITVYEDDGTTVWKQFDLSRYGRAEL